VSDGQRIRTKGRGEPGRNGGPAGDLYITVSVAGHPFFGRRGNDLVLQVPVTFSEAALGAEITVPSLTKPVTLKVPAGTKSGKTFRVRGRGIQQGNHHGDLLVTIDVVVPTELSDEQRTAITAMGATLDGNVRSHLGV